MSRNSAKRARKGKKGPRVPYQNAETATEWYEIKQEHRQNKRNKSRFRKLKEKMSLMQALGANLPTNEESDPLSFTEAPEDTPLVEEVDGENKLILP